MPPTCRVFVRVSPPKHRSNEATALELAGTSVHVKHGAGDTKFEVDGCFSPSISQEVVFSKMGTIALNNAFKGINCSILAYGQEGTGKTWSIMGEPGSHSRYRGLIPRFCENLFYNANKLDLTFAVEMSYAEIFEDRVEDLLYPDNPHHFQAHAGAQQNGNPTFGTNGVGTNPGLRIRMNKLTGPYIEDLSTVAVQSLAEAQQLLNDTVRLRRMRISPEPSHTILSVIFTQVTFDDKTETTFHTTSRVEFVDMAQPQELSLKYSLDAFREAIGSVQHKANNLAVYERSLLTRLLRNSLGGKTQTVFLATVSPSASHLQLTVDTLTLAAQLHAVPCAPRVNTVRDGELVRSVLDQLEAVRSSPSSSQVDAQSLEKLLARLKLSWDQKLEISAEIADNRQEAISRIVTEACNSLTPCLINLARSAPDTELSVYFLKRMNSKVGNLNSVLLTAFGPDDVFLANPKVLQDHCTIESHYGLNDEYNDNVYLHPAPGTHIVVNDEEIFNSILLEHGDQISFCNGEVFQFIHRRDDMEEDIEEAKEDTVRNSIDLISSGQIEPEPAQKLEVVTAARPSPSPPPEAAIVRDPTANYEVFLAQVRKLETISDPKQILTLEKSLQRALDFSRPHVMLRRACQRFKRARVRQEIMDELLNMIPLVDESNAICKALGKSVVFSLEIMPRDMRPKQASPLLHFSRPQDLTIQVRCHRTELQQVLVWSQDQFCDNLFRLRDCYNTAMEYNQTEAEKLDDPLPAQLRLPSPAHHIGSAHLYTHSLLYGLDNRYRLQIFDSQGREAGILEVFVCMGLKNSFEGKRFEPSEPTRTAPFAVGDSLTFTVYIRTSAGVTCASDNFCNASQIRYGFFGEEYHSNFVDQYCYSPPALTSQQHLPENMKKFDPHFDFEFTTPHQISSLTEEHIDWLHKGALTFEIWGRLADIVRAPSSSSDSNGKRRSQQFSQLAQASAAAAAAGHGLSRSSSFGSAGFAASQSTANAPTPGQAPSRRHSVVRSIQAGENQLVRRERVRERIALEANHRAEGTCLLLCVDVQESGKRNAFVPCSLKKVPKESKKTIFRYDLSRELKQFVFTIVQCDEADFLLESFASVKIKSVRVAGDDNNTMQTSEEEHDLLIVDQTCSVHDRVLRAYASWPTELTRHQLLSKATANNARVLIDLEFKLYLAKNTQPALLQYTVVGKIYPKVRNLRPADLWSGEDRLHQISGYYRIHVDPNREAIELIIRKWQRHHADLASALRVDLISQYLSIQQSLEQFGIEVDSMGFVPSLGLDFDDADAKEESQKAVVITVEQCTESPRERSGYLLKRGRRNKAYKRRWCVLRRPYLYYYINEGVGSEQGVVNLIGCTIKKSQDKEVPFEFAIETEDRVWKLQGNSQDDTNAWCRALDPFIQL